MSVDKCHACELAVNRTGENRPGTSCKECNSIYCYKCAKVTPDFCEIVKGMGKSMWECRKCEGKKADMKAVLESMNVMRSELGSLKKDRSEKKW